MTMGASQGSSLELAQAYIATLSILVNARAGGVTSEVIKHALSRRHRLHVQWQATHLGITLQTEGGPAAIIKDVQSKLAPHERTRKGKEPCLMKSTGQKKPREFKVNVAELKSKFWQLQSRSPPLLQGETAQPKQSWNVQWSWAEESLSEPRRRASLSLTRAYTLRSAAPSRLSHSACTAAMSSSDTFAALITSSSFRACSSNNTHFKRKL
ncbi:MAG: hypothetical protein FRX49_07101 [Trebouxia sp. A1-2]|nr:MAG: hypothetical protein FRX49_07101 [Trebouxia sp. A1-2]